MEEIDFNFGMGRGCSQKGEANLVGFGRSGSRLTACSGILATVICVLAFGAPAALEKSNSGVGTGVLVAVLVVVVVLLGLLSSFLLRRRR